MLRPLLALSLVLSGCAVAKPPGWPTERVVSPTRQIVASPGVSPGGAAYLSWDLPDGQTVLVDVDHFRARLIGRNEATFTLRFEGEGDAVVRCTNASVPKEEGWFRCSGIGADGDALAFALGRGVDCGDSRFWTAPCWRGEAQLGDQELRLERGRLRESGWVVGNAAWVEADEPVFGANLVLEASIHLYDPQRATHERDADLLLLTVAVHWLDEAMRHPS